jgi:outer membrane protein TolC
MAQKTFGGTNYYNYVNPQVKLPTWYGVELSAGSLNLDGDRLNNDETPGQTSFVGISVPLAKNLAMDKRRAFLQQAKIFNSIAKLDQQAILNNLLMEAMEAYWFWVKTYQTFVVVKNNVSINEARLILIKKSVENGERPAIDTIEALTQLQSFELQKNQQWLLFQNAGLALSAFLWNQESQPYYLPETVIPQGGWENETNINLFNITLNDVLQASSLNNPNLLSYNYKLEALQIDKKLKFQELLPKIDFNYNVLGKNGLPTITGVLNNNYQVGLKMEMPLFLSAGRGEYRKAKLKISETQIDLSIKQQATEIKIKSYHNELITLQKQVALQSNNYASYTQLLKAEESKFYNGESSMFLINSRETKALEALEKLIDLKTKYFKTLYALQWSAGLLK